MRNAEMLKPNLYGNGMSMNFPSFNAYAFMKKNHIRIETGFYISVTSYLASLASLSSSYILIDRG